MIVESPVTYAARAFKTLPPYEGGTILIGLKNALGRSSDPDGEGAVEESFETPFVG